MKKHNTLKVVLITLAVFVVLSWILPTAAFYQGQVMEQGRNQIGLFDIFGSANVALANFGYIALFIIAVGMFYGVLNRTSAYRVLIDKLVKAFKGKEIIAICSIMAFFAIVTSVCGLQFVLLFTFPFVIALVLAMGYDKIVAALTTFGGAIVGMIGTTFAYNNVMLLADNLGLKFTNGIAYKIIIFLLCLGLLILNTIMYISKKSKTSKEEKKEMEKLIPEEVSTKGKKTRVWPVVLIFDLILVVSILGFIPWEKAFNITIFADITTAVTGFTIPAYIALIVLLLIINLVLVLKKKMRELIIVDSAVGVIAVVILIGKFVFKAKLFVNIFKGLTENFAIFGKILGTNVPAFGNWGTYENNFGLLLVATLIMVGAVVLALVYKVKKDDVLDGFIAGAKKALLPAAFVILVYLGLILCNQYQFVIYKGIFSVTKGFNIFTSSLVQILSTVFNSDPLYAMNNTLPYLTSIVTNTKIYNVIWVLYQSVTGLTLFVAPTSLLMLVTLHYLEIPYGKWLKTVWKLVLEMLAVILIICLIML